MHHAMHVLDASAMPASNRSGLLAHHHIFFSASSLILSEVLQPLLSVCHTSSLERTPKRPDPGDPPLNFTSPPPALSSTTFYSRLKTELSWIYHVPILLLYVPPHVRHHHRLQP